MLDLERDVHAAAYGRHDRKGNVEQQESDMDGNVEQVGKKGPCRADDQHKEQRVGDEPQQEVELAEDADAQVARLAAVVSC